MYRNFLDVYDISSDNKIIDVKFRGQTQRTLKIKKLLVD